MTVDVTPFGVVVAGDSQPVDIFAQRVVIHTAGMKERNPIVRARARDFIGFAGFVGTEEVAGLSTSAWPVRALKSRYSLTLAELCEALAAELTEAWTSSDTHLSVFVAGYEGAEAAFGSSATGTFLDLR